MLKKCVQPMKCALAVLALVACKSNPEPAAAASFGWLESAGNSSGQTTFEVGQPLLVRGWSAGRDDLAPVAGYFTGKPDIYHALQACLIPLYPTDGSLTRALTTGS